jgi:hypothetical protein
MTKSYSGGGDEVKRWERGHIKGVGVFIGEASRDAIFFRPQVELLL